MSTALAAPSLPLSRRLARPAKGALGLVLFLALWQASVPLVGLEPYFYPAPADVWRAFLDLVAKGILPVYLIDSIGRYASGVAIGTVLGIACGLAIGISRLADRTLSPAINFLFAIVEVAWIPIFVIWFGYGVKSALASAAIVSVFPVIANTVDGLRSTDPNLRELFRLYGASRSTTWWKLALPWAVPNIVTGLRIASGLAVIGAIVGEFVSGYAGEDAPLGVVVLSSLREARTDLVFAAVALGALVGFALFGAVSALGWLLMRGRS